MKWITRERPKIDRIACPWLMLKYDALFSWPKYVYDEFHTWNHDLPL